MVADAVVDITDHLVILARRQTAYSLTLFLRDVCDDDLVGWIDARLAGADQAGAPHRVQAMRKAVLEALGYVHEISAEVLSMALADPLMAGDPDRERWVMNGPA